MAGKNEAPPGVNKTGEKVKYKNICDFHSTAWRLLGQTVEMCHLQNNSHSEMIENAGWRHNEPNKTVRVFEAEWNGDGEVPSCGSFVCNSGECPERLMTAIRQHYLRLKECLATGKHIQPGEYFADHKKWADVWSKAMERGFMPDFSKVVEFRGDVIVAQGGSLTAPVLKEVGGHVRVEQGGSLTAPKLNR